MTQLQYITRIFIIGFAYYITSKFLLRGNSVVLVSCSRAAVHFAFLLNHKTDVFRAENTYIQKIRGTCL